MKIYPKLQDYLNNNNSEELENLIENFSVGNDSACKEIATACVVMYNYEMGLDEFPDNVELMNDLASRLHIAIGLHLSVRNGHMNQMGDMTLINDVASFSLTPQGLKSVEDMIKK